MNILLCVSKTDLTFYFQQPVETLYTGTILKQQGHNVSILDFRTGQISQEDLAHYAPHLIFLVTCTYDRSQGYSLSLVGPQSVATTLRASFPRVPLIAVGTHGSIEPHATLRALDVDHILPGELEACIPWFVDAYEHNPKILWEALPLKDIPLQVDPATLPVPDYDLLTDLSLYYGEAINPHNGVVRSDTTGLIFANRGCPYACSYCFVWFGKKLRTRPVALVVEELAQQAARGVHNFFFLDYTFTLDHAWVRALCAAIRERNLAVTWICQTRCERVDLELLQEMQSAGCTGIYYGVEAPWIADTEMAKPTSRKVIEETIHMTNAANIRCFLFILIGLEAQDPIVGRQLVDWLAQVPAIFTANPLLPRPHTDLWKRHNGPARASSWESVMEFSVSTLQNHYWYPEMRGLVEDLQRLPNYILNVSVNGFVVR